MSQQLTTRTLWALVLVIALSSLAFASSAVIGVAMAKGGFRVNDAVVSGNATLFDGAVIETSKASSTIRMGSGATLHLAGDSRGRFFQDHMILERGRGELTGSYTLEALGVRVQADQAGSTGRIALAQNTVQVAAVSGSFRVTNASGFVVGNVGAGNALAFEPQSSGAAAPSSISGCLSKADGKFYLTDEISGVKVQLLGSKLDAEAGRRVEIVGTAVANQQVQVNTIKRIADTCSTAPAAAGATRQPRSAGSTAAGAGKAGMSAGTKAIIAGVAVAAGAATTAGVYAATSEEATASSR